MTNCVKLLLTVSCIDVIRSVSIHDIEGPFRGPSYFVEDRNDIMSLQLLEQAFNNYSTKLKSYVDRTIGSFVSRNVVREELTIASDQTVSYDLSTLLGSDHASYDKLGSHVIVRVVDNDDTSPTYNEYIYSAARISITAAGVVKVTNTSGEDAVYFIRIDTPRNP